MEGQGIAVSPMRVLNILAEHHINRGYNTVALDNLSDFVAAVVNAEWTDVKLVGQLTSFYELVDDHQLHDIGDPEQDNLGLDPIMIELVNAYEQARTNC